MIVQTKLYGMKERVTRVISFCDKCELTLLTVTTGLSTTGEKAQW